MKKELSMSRQNRLSLPDYPHHVIQRGNNKSDCFNDESDFVAYSGILRESAAKSGCKIHSWTFMTNHVHLLATPDDKYGISKMMQFLGSSYVPYFNKKYDRTGTLWEGRFRSVIVDTDDYFFKVQRYIELNPVRAKMVSDPAEYTWSSYHHNALGKLSTLVTEHPLYLSLGDTPEQRQSAYRNMFGSDISPQDSEFIRKMTNRGDPIGNKSFVNQVESMTGVDATKLSHGGDRRSTVFCYSNLK